MTSLVWQARAELERRRRATSLTRRSWREDFGVFATLVDIIPKGGERQKLRPNAIQAAFEASRTGRDLVLKPRQVGLTTWELARDAWFFLTRKGARVVVVCQSMSDDGAIRELSDKLRVMFESLAPMGIGLDVAHPTATTWKLPSSNASLRIVGAGASEAAASKKGRSGTIHRLHVTELAFFEWARETVNAMFECVPGLEHGTEVVLESTANGAAGMFFELYQGAKAGRSSFNHHFFSWLQQSEYRALLSEGESLVPESARERDIVGRYGGSAEQLKWYRQKVADKGQDLVDQEYPSDEITCWLSAGRCFFDKDVTQALLSKSTEPLLTDLAGTLRIWEQPRPGAAYLVVADPSEGTGGDPGAAIVFDRAGKHVATVHGQFPPWPFGELLVAVAKRFNGATIAIERNNHGHAVLQSVLAGQKYPQERVYRGPDGKFGWLTNEVARSAALDALEEAHRRGFWASPDVRVIGEQRTFVVNKHGKAEAAPGAHDDLIMASAIGWDVLRRPQGRRDLSNLPAA